MGIVAQELFKVKRNRLFLRIFYGSDWKEWKAIQKEMVRKLVSGLLAAGIIR